MIYCVMLCGLSVVVALCVVCGRVFCNNCVYVCDSFAMYRVTVRGLCLCGLPSCVCVKCACFVCMLLCCVVCGFLCVRCVCVRASMCVCFVCGLLCDVVWFAFDAC